MSFVFRDYQQELDDKIKVAIRAGARAIVVRAPTGAGKTVMFASQAARAEAKGGGTTILVPRRELAYQTVSKLLKFGVTPGIIMAGEPMHYHRKVQVGSFDTLHSRAMRTNKIELPPAKLLIPDEAHLSVAETRMAIIERYKQMGTLILAYTATPARSDGLSLGRVYDTLVEGWTTQQMIDAGYLVKPRYFCPSPLDLSKLNISRHTGDFDEDELEAEFDKPQLVGEIVDNWMRIASNRRTVVFCITRKHARHVLERFLHAGVRAEYVDGETPLHERAGIFQRVTDGRTQVLVNVFVATFGLDIPRLDCAVLARPTKSLVLYLQIGGRVLRPVYEEGDEPPTVAARLASIAASVKPDCLIIDHAGAINEHGLLEDDIPWSIADDGKTVSERKLEKQEQEKALKEITCPSCKTVFKGSRFCPNCGQQLIQASEPVPFYKADLIEVDTGAAEGKRANRVTSWDDKAAFYASARGYAARKGFKPGWASNKYKDKFGVWPNDPRVRNAPALTAPATIFTNYMTMDSMRRKFASGGRP